MDSSVSYRAELPFIAFAYRDDHHAAITIPSGRLIRVIGPEDDRFLVIEIDGEQFQAFEADLESRTSVHAERDPARASLSANASL